MVLVSGDLVDITEDLMGRVAQLEQRITSPYFTIPNGSEPTFPVINVGDWRGTGTLVPIQQLISSPTGLTATASTTFTDVAIDATWTAPADASAVQYQIDIAVKNNLTGTYAIIDSRTTSGTTAHISNLDPGKTYGIKVSGINRIGIVSAPTPAAGWFDVATSGDASIPAAPTGVSATAGTTSVMVTWDDNTESDVVGGVGQYQVQYDTNSAFSAAKTISTTATIASFTGLTSGVPYYFRVRAVDSSGNQGPFSGTVSATPGTAGGGGAAPSDGNPPASSPTPSAVQGGAGWLYAKWNAVVNVDPVTYDVHISTVNGFTPDATTKVMETSATSAFIKTLADGTALVYGTTYYVKLVARDRDGSAAAGGQGSGAPAQISTGDIAAGSITATSGIIASLDAGAITTGTLDASRISVTNLNATSILGGTITSDKINATVGLDATLIKFNTMSGDRISAHTLDINAIKTSTLAATTLTLDPTGAIIGGSNPLGSGTSQTGFVLNGGALTTFKGGATSFRLDFSNGNAFFAGDITGSTGTFSGSLSGATVTGGVIQTSSLTTVDRITIDPANGLVAYREATTNLVTEPYFVRLYPATTGDEYQVMPGDTSVVGSAWSFSYPAGGTYSAPATGVTIDVGYLPKRVPGYPLNPIGAPPGAIRYNFTSTAAAGVYRIMYTAAATAGLSYAASYYHAVSNIAGLAGNLPSYMQFLNGSGAALATVTMTRIRDGAVNGSFQIANVWERFGALGVAPAGTTSVRIGIYVGNLATTGAYVGAHYVYGAQMEQKDHYTAYCDGNQYNCTWSTGRPQSTSSRAYDSVGRFGGSTGLKGSNIMVGSVLGGRGDRVIAGTLATAEIDPSTSSWMPGGGGISIGQTPSYDATAAWSSQSNVITFIPEFGVWGAYNEFPYIWGHTYSTVGNSGVTGGYEYPMELLLYSGTTKGNVNDSASIHIESGSAGVGSSIDHWVSGAGAIHNFHGGMVYSSGRMQVGSTDAVQLNNTCAFQIGPDGTAKLLMDQNEITAQSSSGTAGALFLNNQADLAAGPVNMGNTSTLGSFNFTGDLASSGRPFFRTRAPSLDGGFRFGSGNPLVRNFLDTAYQGISASSFAVSSSEDVKEDITDVLPEHAHAIVLGAPAKKWKYTNSSEADRQHYHFHPLAEDLPLDVLNGVDTEANTGNGFLVDLRDMIGVLWAAEHQTISLLQSVLDRLDALERIPAAQRKPYIPRAYPVPTPRQGQLTKAK